MIGEVSSYDDVNLGSFNFLGVTTLYIESIYCIYILLQELPKLKTLVIGSYCFTEVRNVFIQGLYFLLFIIRFTILKAFRIRTFCFPG